jgi:hypothetical protein
LSFGDSYEPLPPPLPTSGAIHECVAGTGVVDGAASAGAGFGATLVFAAAFFFLGALLFFALFFAFFATTFFFFFAAAFFAFLPLALTLDLRFFAMIDLPIYAIKPRPPTWR